MEQSTVIVPPVTPPKYCSKTKNAAMVAIKAFTLMPIKPANNVNLLAFHALLQALAILVKKVNLLIQPPNNVRIVIVPAKPV